MMLKCKSDNLTLAVEKDDCYVVCKESEALFVQCFYLCFAQEDIRQGIINALDSDDLEASDLLVQVSTAAAMHVCSFVM